jgi:hypothetical protein
MILLGLILLVQADLQLPQHPQLSQAKNCAGFFFL